MSQTSFEDRVTRLNRRHERLTLGVSYRVGPDGLITAMPDRRVGARFPLRALLFVLVLAFAFKAILFAGLGEATYENRRALLLEGSAAERAAAWVMQPDPGVRLVAQVVAALPLP